MKIESRKYSTFFGKEEIIDLINELVIDSAAEVDAGIIYITPEEIESVAKTTNGRKLLRDDDDLYDFSIEIRNTLPISSRDGIQEEIDIFSKEDLNKIEKLY